MAAAAVSASICCAHAVLSPASKPPTNAPPHFALGSPNLGFKLVSAKSKKWHQSPPAVAVSGSVVATTAAAVTQSEVKPYALPTWTDFEMGYSCVYWETSTGRPPSAGEQVIIYFNPTSSKVTPNDTYGVAFNGGFNQPIMCGGEPRVMTPKNRGIKCAPFYTIKINVPRHALTLEFSFTDGKEWDGPYKIQFGVYPKFKNMPASFFAEGLAKELSQAGACESAIYPDSVFVEDRCEFPAGLIHEGGNKCDLDIVPGCTDPNSPNFNPLANVDDGSCPYFSDSD